MNSKYILDIIANANNDIIYVADIETYELIYLNKAARNAIGVSDDSYVGKPCYRLLQGYDAPCPFCTNSLLSKDRFYTWEHYNESLKTHYWLRDKLVEYKGRLVRLEIATDITKKEEMQRMIAEQLEVNETLVKCIDTLKNGKDVNAAIDRLLHHVGEFYQADRAYIFEINEKNNIFSNTYEWCRQEVSSEIQNLQDLPLAALERWLEEFRKNGFIGITSLGKTLLPDSLEYQILQPQGIESLIAAPLAESDGKIIGLIGVDNPRANFESAQLLCSISAFVVDDLAKRAMLAQLERLSYEDVLTGLYNRNRYIKQMQDFQASPPESLGVLYLDINRLKEANDVYGHAYGDQLIVQAADLLRSAFSSGIYRVGGDEFVVLRPNIGQEEFEALAGRFREAVKQAEGLDISVGAAWSSGEQDAMNQVMRADELMYAEKQLFYRSGLTGSPEHQARIAEELADPLQFRQKK